MRTTACRQESKILHEARVAPLCATARDHLASCETCSHALQVDRLLYADSQGVPSLDSLPDPTLIWWRARQQARLRQAERATLPIQIAEHLALALGGLGLLVGLSLTWPVARATVGQWLSDWAAGLAQALPLGGTALVLALAGSIVLLVGFGLYSQSIES